MSSTTKKKAPTAAQKKAADLVRGYFRNKRLDIEEDEVNDDGHIVLFHSDRESASYDEPSARMREQYQTYVAELRDLAPLVFVFREYVDEWIHLTVTIRDKARKPRPEPIQNLDVKLLERMPESILKHSKVEKVRRREYRAEYSGLEAVTSIPGKYSGMFLRADLTWDLRGNTVDGWELIVNWGCHRVRRDANFKKLTPKIILEQLAKITDLLDDPMDCLDYTIHVKQDGTYIPVWTMNPGPKKPETYSLYQVTARDEVSLRAPQGGTEVVFINNLTRETTELPVGERIPDKLKPLSI